MLLILYRFVCGWLNVRFYGPHVSRFLNLCTRHGITLWNVDSVDTDCIHARMYVRDLYELRPVFRKTRVKFQILSKNGLPFFMHRYRKRKALVGVMLVVICGVVFFSSRIWRIEFVGNSSISDETLMEYLASHQIEYGTGRSQINNDALELSLRQDFEPIIWASVYEEGTKLVVCIQEKIISDRAALKTKDEPADLVATKDAKIESIITRKGIGKVKAGDFVKKGDVLVAGCQEINDDNGEVREYYYETADADVIGEVTYDYEDWIDTEVITTVRTGNKHTRFFVRMADYQMTTPAFYAEFERATTLEQNQQLCLMDSFYLPIYYGKIIDYEEEQTVKKQNMQDAKTIGMKHLNHFLINLEENGVSIIDKNVMIERIGKKYHVYGKVTATESITKQQPIEIRTNPVQELENENKE